MLTRIIMGDNPWLEDGGLWEESVRRHLPEVFVPRFAEERLARDGLVASKASLIVGPRQAGKSTLAWHTILSCKLRALLVNCEERAVQELARSPAIFLQEMASFLSRSAVLFLEEAQHLDDAGLFVKGIVDRKPGIPVLVTGSSGYDLLSKTRESLAGRASRFRLLPFSLGEVGEQWRDLPTAARELRLEESWRTQAVFGGYPEVWMSDSRELLLSRLVDSFLMRDVSDLYRIARPDAFRKVVRLAALQTGNLVNFSEYASICGISADTVAAYLGIMQDAHVIHLLQPFAGGRRAELKLRPKIYFIDCGLRNAMLGAFGEWENRPDKGPLLENWVLGELVKGPARPEEVHHWRSKSAAEVDFVIRRRSGLTGIEIKSDAMARPRLSRSSQSFLAAYQPKTFIVVNTGLDHSEQRGGTHVRWIRPSRLTETLGEE